MAQKKDKTDLRVKRTLKNIREAFFQLIMEKDYQSISITELTTRADINRKTFYLHYNSISDLARDVEQEILKELTDQFTSLSDPTDITECVRIFYTYLENCTPEKKKLLCDPDYQFFYSRLTKDLFETPFFKKFYATSTHPNIVMAYCISISTMYRAWSNEEAETFPLNEFIEFSSDLLKNGYSAIIK